MRSRRTSPSASETRDRDGGEKHAAIAICAVKDLLSAHRPPYRRFVDVGATRLLDAGSGVARVLRAPAATPLGVVDRIAAGSVAAIERARSSHSRLPGATRPVVPVVAVVPAIAFVPVVAFVAAVAFAPAIPAFDVVRT